MRNPDGSLEIGRLKRRADFLHVGRGRRCHKSAMTVQMAAAKKDPSGAAVEGVRVGFTLTKKVGNAVVRNRCRRRLKEAVRHSPDLPVVIGHDYVIVGRVDAMRLRFVALKNELQAAVRGVHAKGRDGSSGERKPGERGPKRIRREP